MKYFILICSILLIVQNNQAQNLYFQTSLKDAFALAKNENKFVFIEYYNEYCHVCKNLEPVFADSLMATFYNPRFINYKLNTENIKTEDEEFMNRSGLKPTSVPIFFFFDKNEKLVHFAYPSKDINELIEIGKTALNEKECAANLPHKYKKGDRSIKTLYAYSNMAQLYEDDSLVTVLADDLFESFPKQNLGNKKSYVITKNCVNSIENGFFKYWINNIEQLTGLETGAKKGKEKEELGKILLHSIHNSASKKWDLSQIQAAKDMIIKLELSKNPDAFFWQQELSLLLNAKRNDEALEYSQHLLDLPQTDIKDIINYFTYFFNNIHTKKELIAIKKMLDEQYAKFINEDDNASFYNLTTMYQIKVSELSNE